MYRDKSFDARLGAELKARREAAGVQMAAVARAMGVDKSTVACYESGRNAMSASALIRYCELVGIDAAELVKLVRG